LFSQRKDVTKTESDAEEFRVERIAVIVGVNDYIVSNIPDLSYASTDADLVEDLLEEKGTFTTLIFNDEKRKPTKYDIMKTLEDVREYSKTGNLKTFVFYFSGHGFEVDGVNYLAPMEINPDNIADTGISMDDVLSITNDIKQKGSKAMVFIDACRNNPESSSQKGFTGTFGDTDSQGLGVIYSTSSGDYSYEDPDFEKGVFTNFLTEALDGKGDVEPYGNGDGFVSFEECVKYVSIMMREWSNNNRFGWTQTPNISSIDKYGEFFITKAEIEQENLSVVIDPNTPMLEKIQNNIDLFTEKGLILTDISFNDYCFVSASTNPTFTEQIYYIAEEDPDKFIRSGWIDGYSITNINYINGYWIVIMSYDDTLGIQDYTIADEFPENFYITYFDQWYYITEMNYLHEIDKWALVMSKGTKYQDQYYLKTGNDLFPENSIKQDYNDGYIITDLIFDGDVWYAAMSLPQKPINQRYDKINRACFGQTIESLWDEKYEVAEIFIQDEKTIYVVSNREPEKQHQGAFIVSPGMDSKFFND
jgi:hypothetical protein